MINFAVTYFQATEKHTQIHGWSEQSITFAWLFFLTSLSCGLFIVDDDNGIPLCVPIFRQHRQHNQPSLDYCCCLLSKNKSYTTIFVRKTILLWTSSAFYTITVLFTPIKRFSRGNKKSFQCWKRWIMPIIGRMTNFWFILDTKTFFLSLWELSPPRIIWVGNPAICYCISRDTRAHFHIHDINLVQS